MPSPKKRLHHNVLATALANIDRVEIRQKLRMGHHGLGAFRERLADPKLKTTKFQLRG
jgi:hypothetical protein